MNKVYLHGNLGKRFGRKWEVHASNCEEIIKAIDCNEQDFVPYIIAESLQGNEHFLLRKHPKKIKNEDDLIENIIQEGDIDDCEVHIVPQVYGGVVAAFVGKFIASKAIVGAVTGAVWGAVAQVGIQALQKSQAPQAQTHTSSSSVSTKSFLSEPRVERASKEGVIPVGYGRLIVGPNMISQSNTISRFGAGNLLQSYGMTTISHVISEGPIEGAVNEYGLPVDDLDEALYLNDVQVKTRDSYNFVLNEQNIPAVLFTGDESFTDIVQTKTGYIFAYNQTLYGASPYDNFTAQPIYGYGNWLDKVKIITMFIGLGWAMYELSKYNYGKFLLGFNLIPAMIANSAARKAFVTGAFKKKLQGYTQPTATVSVPDALQYAKIFSHKINNENVSSVKISLRGSTSLVNRANNKTQAETVSFAIFIVREDGIRYNVREFESGCEVDTSYFSKAGLGESKAPSKSDKPNAYYFMSGLATDFYEFQIPISFNFQVPKEGVTIQVVKLSRELDPTVASNVYSETHTPTYKRTWYGAKKPTGTKVTKSHTWNAIGGGGRTRALVVASVEEIIDAELIYPKIATSIVTIDSQNFANQPSVSWHLRLKKVAIPSNYNPYTRKYHGPWNGLFQGQRDGSDSIYSISDSNKFWTDNPAWIFYDLVSNPVFGCGVYGVQEEDIDKWQLYKAAKYCDELVETHYPIETENGLLNTFTWDSEGGGYADNKIKIKVDKEFFTELDGEVQQIELSDYEGEKKFEYNSAGSYTLTIPEGVNQIQVTVTGGGGSGGIVNGTQGAVRLGNSGSASSAYKTSNGRQDLLIQANGGQGGSSATSIGGSVSINNHKEIIYSQKGGNSRSAKITTAHGGNSYWGSGSNQINNAGSTSSPTYGAGSGANGLTTWFDIVNYTGGAAGGTGIAIYDVIPGDVITINVGAGGAAASHNNGLFTRYTGTGGSGRVIIDFVKTEINNLQDKFKNEFGAKKRFQGKYVAFFVYQHKFGNDAYLYENEIKKRSVLRLNPYRIERRQIVSVDESTYEVTLSGEDFSDNPAAFEKDGRTIMYGACAVEINHPIVEPRFSANVYLKSPREAIDVLSMMASVFRGMLAYNSGRIGVGFDSIKTPVQLFNNSNVTKEGFAYSSSEKSQRFTVVKVTFNNKENNFEAESVYEEDPIAMQKLGYIVQDIPALTVTSQSEARRLAKWILFSNQYQKEMVKFVTGREGSYTAPGSIIEVFDEMRTSDVRSGRIADIVEDIIYIDKSAIKDPFIGKIEFTVASGQPGITQEQLENRSSFEKNEEDQDFEIENLTAPQVYRFSARILPDLSESSNVKQDRAIVVDLLLKIEFELSVGDDIIKILNHGFKSGDKVVFSSDGMLPSGLSPFLEYYVINPTKHTFQVSEQLNGERVDIFDEGKDHLLNIGGSHFVSPLDQEYNQNRIDQIAIGSSYSIKSRTGFLERTKSLLTQSELELIGVSSPITDGWMLSDIFGYIKIFDKKWIFAVNLGWVYIENLLSRNINNTTQYFWFYVGDMGWVGTNELNKNTIWFSPSHRKNQADASGYMYIQKDGSNENISSVFVYQDAIDETIEYYNVGGTNKESGRRCSIIGYSSNAGASGYWVDLQTQGLSSIADAPSVNDPVQSIDDYYNALKILNAEKVQEDVSLQAKESVVLEVDVASDFKLKNNYSVMISGVTATSFSEEYLNENVNITWQIIAISESEIELRNSENFYSIAGNLNFDNAYINVVNNFNVKFDTFVRSQLFRVLNNKEIDSGQHEILAIEHSNEKFESIDKVGVIRRPVTPIPPQENMEIPEAPTNLILTGITS